MRRGLMGWNAEELPKAALEARIARLRAAMQRGGFDAALFYTNLVQPSAVTWLTGFTPYWSDGMLLLPRERRAGVRDRAVEARRQLDPHHRHAERDRQHAEAGRRRRQADRGRRLQARRRAGIRQPAGRPFRRDRRRCAGCRACRHQRRVRRCAARHRRCRTRAHRPRRSVGEHGARPDRCGQGDRCRRGRRRWSKSTRGSAAPRKPISPSRPISTPTARMIRVAGTLPLAGRFAVRASVAYKGCLGAADAKLRARRGRAPRLRCRRCVAGARCVVDRAGQAVGCAACRSSEGASRRDSAAVRWPKAAPAAIRSQPSRQPRPREVSSCSRSSSRSTASPGSAPRRRLSESCRVGNGASSRRAHQVTSPHCQTKGGHASLCPPYSAPHQFFSVAKKRTLRPGISTSSLRNETLLRMSSLSRLLPAMPTVRKRGAEVVRPQAAWCRLSSALSRL